MVSTRTKSSVSTSTKSSSYKSSTYKSATRYHLDTPSSSRLSDTASTSTSRFQSLWETWYDAFAAEVNDESPNFTSTQRRQEAETRWAQFASKSLRCPEADVRTWLSSSSPRTSSY